MIKSAHLKWFTRRRGEEEASQSLLLLVSPRTPRLRVTPASIDNSLPTDRPL